MKSSIFCSRSLLTAQIQIEDISMSKKQYLATYRVSERCLLEITFYADNFELAADHARHMKTSVPRLAGCTLVSVSRHLRAVSDEVCGVFFEVAA